VEPGAAVEIATRVVTARVVMAGTPRYLRVSSRIACSTLNE
jgi:hypothetical protein